MQNQKNLMIQTWENGRKPPIWAILGLICPILGQIIFIFENRASSLFYIYQSLTSCKKSEKSNGGKYENFWDGQTDRRTDGRGFIRTPEGVLIIENKQSGSRTPQRKKKEKKKGDKNRSQTLFRFIEDKVLQKNLSIVGMWGFVTNRRDRPIDRHDDLVL